MRRAPRRAYARAVSRQQRRPLARELARRFPDVEESAEELIAAGAVIVDGVPRTNPRMLVDAGSSVRIDAEPRALRGEAKLRAALDGFALDPSGSTALDAGAAAGGFVRALLDAGARRVYAVDAGYGQLRGSLAQDPRVVNLERTNLGELARALVPEPLDLVTLDVGFLALTAAVPQLASLELAPSARLLGLVKPMFELGLPALPDDDALVDEAIARAAAGVAAAGWEVLGTMRSAVTGSRGAVEGWVHATRVVY
jgi:23S rRNA (cytidine1920-2'-O)/16S rRNA (cytidine1409-2'-O)-methyltransferase